MNLPRSVSIEIEKLSKLGNKAMDCGRFEEAFNHFNSAWKLVPSPQNEFDASTWILAAIADVYFHTQKWEKMVQALEFAMICPGGLRNPFLHLRFGQALFELGQHEKSKDELARALMGEGRDIFKGEDKKYFDFISQHMKPPAGQSEW